MPLPRDLAVALIDRFTPVLCMDLAEPAYPVSPVDYVQAAALWASNPPTHPRPEWGLPGATGRQPLIPRRAITLDPAQDVHGQSDPDGDGVPEFYLGQTERNGYFTFLQMEGREPWFDYAGWQDGDDVTTDTANRRARTRDGQDLTQPWFSSDVWTIEDLAAGLGAEQLTARLGLVPDDLPPELKQVVVLTFGFLSPATTSRGR